MLLEELQLPLSTIDKGFKAGIGAAIAGVTALVGAMGLAVKATFDWAGELDSIGDVMGVTNEQAAALNFTLRKSGTDTAALTKGMTILEKSLVKSDGTIDTVGKSLLNFGINFRDANGQVKDQATLIQDISKRYNEFSTQQEKVNFLTEVFGRSGADLIDFFDVLASEGGIDAVSEKVKALGLAIDPARYEQFNRNLEELKLIGLGLAVAFTEQVMPVLENVLGWFTRLANAPIEEQFAMLADPLKLLFNFTDWFNRAVDEVDWGGLSQSLAAKISALDWELIGSYVRQGFKNVLEGLSTVVAETDWSALGLALGDAWSRLLAGVFNWKDQQYLFDNWLNDFGYAIRSGFDKIVGSIKATLNSLFTDFTFQGIPGRGGALPGTTGRASGGPVIKGQAYSVAEFFRPEVFIPQTNGSIQPAANLAGGGITEADLLRLGGYFATALRSELQKSGRR